MTQTREEACAVFSIGSLVSANDQRGTGKVVHVDGSDITVEYFESIAQRRRATISASALKAVRISPETRCYVQEEGGDGWRVGRVGMRSESSYEVKFPDRMGAYLPESQLFVRCASAISDPMDILVHRAHETAFFSERRFPFVRTLVEQRAASRGLSGLVSSRIELYAHQVEVIRRVLEDPVQRYLLADEVGLGKTIEAGAILRQFLLDDRSGRAIVLVPPLLKHQWIAELEDKFGVFAFGDRVEILGTNEMDQLTLHEGVRFVIIDEAHHVARLAGDAASVEWETFRNLAHSAERLLLLSATPALHNEQAFLAMLHLLDPSVHRLDQLDAFRERVRTRQDMGRFLLSFNEGAPSFSLRRALSRLADLFPEDSFLVEARAGLLRALDEEDPLSRDRLIRQIRTHIGETHRLHRRLLRNRRSAVEQGLTAGRGGDRSSLVEEYDLDTRTPRLHNLLDDWRVAAFASSLEMPEADQSALNLVFLTLLEVSGTWLGLFEEALRLRRGQSASDRLRSSISPEAIDALKTLPHFPGENGLLDAMLEILAEDPEDGDRIELLRLILESIQRADGAHSSKKTVVFTSYPLVWAEIVDRLHGTLGVSAIAMHSTGMAGEAVEQEVKRFRDDDECFVLVCDRSGEEGRNLQFADWLIHFDLPFSPNRIEQRIGRLDRIGRVHAMRSRVFVGPEVDNSMSEAWFEMLRDGIGVFHDSIASLQFFIDSKLQELTEALFRNGSAGLRALLEDMRDHIAREQTRLNEQHALDEIDALSSDARSFFELLEGFDADHDRIRRTTELWICDTLQFDRNPDEGSTHIMQYRPRQLRGGTTLVPLDFLIHALGPQEMRSGTFRRTVAAQTPGISLFRVGDAFIDTMARYIEWDDRGRASAIWRCEAAWSPEEGDEWTGFRFHYVVEADTKPALEHLRETELHSTIGEALRRQADALLPPRFETAWIGSDGAPVTDPRLLSLLHRPYRHPKDYGSDFNLHKHRIEYLDQVVERGLWPQICSRARQASEELLREDPSFQKDCEMRASQAERRVERRLDQLRLRARLQGGEGADVELERDLGELLIEGVRSPGLKLDGVTFFVISGRNPFEFERSPY